MKNNNREIEVRFLNISPKSIIKKLQKLNAKDEGQYKILETIFYDKQKTWLEKGKFVRLRKARNKIFLSYKHHQKHTATGTFEIEFEVSSFNKAKLLSKAWVLLLLGNRRKNDILLD